MELPTQWTIQRNGRFVLQLPDTLCNKCVTRNCYQQSILALDSQRQATVGGCLPSPFEMSPAGFEPTTYGLKGAAGETLKLVA